MYTQHTYVKRTAIHSDYHIIAIVLVTQANFAENVDRIEYSRSENVYAVKNLTNAI